MLRYIFFCIFFLLYPLVCKLMLHCVCECVLELLSIYLFPTEQLCLKVNPQTKDEGPTHHCQPGHQPQALGQTHPPLLAELHLERRHGSLPGTNRHRHQREKWEEGSSSQVEGVWSEICELHAKRQTLQRSAEGFRVTETVVSAGLALVVWWVISSLSSSKLFQVEGISR